MEMSSSASFDPAETDRMVKKEDTLYGFEHLLETLSDPEFLSSRHNWNLFKNPSLGICLFRVEPNDDFTNLSLGSKVFIRKDLRMNFVGEENFPVDPKEIDLSPEPSLESFSQLRRILNHFTSNPQPKLRSSTHQLLQQAFDLLSKISGIEQIVEPIRNMILEAIVKLDPLSEDFHPKIEDDPPTVMLANIKTELIESDHEIPDADVELEELEEESNDNDMYETESSSEPRRPRKRGKKSAKSESGVYQCDRCERVFPTTEKRRQHFYRAHLGPAFCDRCGKNFKSLIALKKHIGVHEEERKKVKCPHCEVTVLPHSLSKHIKTTHEGYKPHSCSYCGKCFTAIASLRTHEKAHESFSEMKGARYECPKCMRAYDRGGKTFADHVNICTGVPIEKSISRYQCFMCDKKFPSKVLCSHHMEVRHNHFIGNFKKFCFECKKEVEDPIMHSRIHTCPFQCETCGTRFSTQEKLANHETVKHGNGNQDRPWKCDSCSSSFKCNSHLQSHILNMHRTAEEKPFECEICQKRFGLKSHLNSHTKLIHGKKERFTCNFCGDKYKNLASLKSHCKMRHGEECIYPCPDCPQKLKTLSDLKNHREEMHGETIAIHKYHNV